jgi:LAO/AO transport system kinase
MLHLKMKDKEDRQIKVLKTIASQGKGIEELFKEITEHNEYLIKNGKLKQKRKTNLLKHINELVNSRLEFKFWSEERKKILEEKTEIILNRESTPYELVDELIKHFY